MLYHLPNTSSMYYEKVFPVAQSEGSPNVGYLRPRADVYHRSPAIVERLNRATFNSPSERKAALLI